MTTDEVTIYTISNLKTSFDIEGIPDFLCIKIGYGKTLLHAKKLIILGSNMSEGHTSTIVGNALSFFENIRECILDTKHSSFSCKNRCLMFYNSRKHKKLLIRKSKYCYQKEYKCYSCRSIKWIRLSYTIKDTYHEWSNNTGNTDDRSIISHDFPDFFSCFIRYE